MDTQKECEIQVHQPKEIEEQYQLLNCERSRTSEELAQQNIEDEHHINNELMWLSHLEKGIERRMSEIKMLQSFDPEKVKLSLPVSFVPRTTDSLCLTEKDAHTQVRPDLKRCKRRLIKKGRMAIEYLEEVQELSSMKSRGITYYGTQELNAMIESMVQRIQHGNKKRADEMKTYQEISNFMEKKESSIAPAPRHPLWVEPRSKLTTDRNRFRQHIINIRLDEIEKLMRQIIGRKARVRRLKVELQYVRRSIIYLNKKLENVDSKIHKAYKCGDQKK